MSARQKWIGLVRMIFAFLLTPVIILVWWWISFNVLMRGRNVDCPAGVIVLGFSLFPAVILMFLSAWGLDAFLPLAKDLKFRALALATVAVALINGLLFYLPACPWGATSVAPVLGGLSALGILLSALSFYVVGVWRTIRKS